MLLFIYRHVTVSVFVHGVMFDYIYSVNSYHLLLQITKKLAGTARATGLWLTSVGNEYGQVLISVLTAQEGAGLDTMVDGLVKRYRQAGVEPTCCVVRGLWVLHRGGRDQAENQIQRLARSRDTLGHLAFYAQDCLGVYN